MTVQGMHVNMTVQDAREKFILGKLHMRREYRLTAFL